MAQANGKQASDRTGGTNAERVTLLVSVLVVAALVGLIIFQYVTGGSEPPAITVQPLVEQVEARGEVYYLPVEVTNEGDLAAEDVEVQLTLGLEGEDPEVVQFTVPFLAGHETDEQTLIFNHDPRRGELSQVVSFHKP